MFFSGDIEKLNQQQLQIFGRIDYADGMIRRYGAGRTTAKRILAYWLLKKVPYTLRQAYRDMESATELNAATSRSAKGMDKLFVIEILKKEISNVRKREKDPSKRGNTIARLVEQMNKIEKYSEKDEELPDFEGIGANDYIITVDPQDIGIKPVIITDDIRRKYEEPGRYNFDAADVEDVDHDEIDTDEQ